MTRLPSARSAARATAVVLMATATTATGPGGVATAAEAAPGTVSYARAAADITGVGKPLDLLMHPVSGKLYVGGDILPAAPETDERGLYALDPATGAVLSHVPQAPGPNGLPRAAAVARFAGPLPGAADGVVFNYPLRGLGSAKDGDAAAQGVWLAGATVTGVGQGFSAGTTLVGQGAVLSETETATGTVKRSVTPGGIGLFAVDTARKAVWFGDFDAGRLHRVDEDTFTVMASYDIPAGLGSTRFVVVDPADGSVWVGRGNTVSVFAAGGALRTTLKGVDLAGDVAFDTVTHRAYVVWMDGDSDSVEGSDANGVGSLGVYDTETLAAAAESVPIPQSSSQYGNAAVAVTPGGGAVFVTNPNLDVAKVMKFVRKVSPKVTGQPADVTAAAGGAVELAAHAAGTPAPAVRWQSSADSGATWQNVEGDAAAKDTYAFTAEATLNGRRYRAEFSNDTGVALTDPVTLTVTAKGPEDPGTEDPGTEDPGTEDPGTEDPGTQDPGTQDPGTEDPGTEQPGGDGGSGSAGASGGTVGDTGITPNGSPSGSLASTGASMLPAAGAAAALLAAGVVAVRRSRRREVGE
ncbi:hypothetical protein ACIHCQ_40085 [Streptomyces sp. NPDC052236]|uniref:hypothetical protein n=1 Tax=Streptomyces sp. NPDC052236 TaxID=3365686 RepID=UPI0037CDCDEA